jgi:hypothetical protein
MSYKWKCPTVKSTIATIFTGWHTASSSYLVGIMLYDLLPVALPDEDGRNEDILVAT